MTQPGRCDWGKTQLAALLPLALGAAALGSLMIAAGAPAWRACVLLLLAPVAEEIVFRAGLQDGLLHLTVVPWLANLLTALAFGASHMLLLGVNPETALVWIPALLIGAAYNRWRQLPLCIALHMVMNAAWLIVQTRA